MSRVTVVVSAAITGITLAIAAVPMLLLDPRANDGAASMTALFALPMIATGVLIEVHRPTSGNAPFVARMLPWVGGLVVGMLSLGIPATLLEPDYYESHTQGGMLAVLAMFAFVMAFGAASGVVFWVLVVLPIAALARGAAAAWRGGTLPPRTVALPAGTLVVVALVLVAFQREPEELVLVQVAIALLGLPGFVDWAGGDAPHLALWVIRLVIVGLAVGAGTVIASTRARSQSQTR
jgi:hypothetical protein